MDAYDKNLEVLIENTQGWANLDTSSISEASCKDMMSDTVHYLRGKGVDMHSRMELIMEHFRLEYIDTPGLRVHDIVWKDGTTMLYINRLVNYNAESDYAEMEGYRVMRDEKGCVEA